ncbi:MAG: ABC transporter permease [Desulfobacterales bacterium]|nr:ABC transporter permease [Desulfobacterales bacterium]
MAPFLAHFKKMVADQKFVLIGLVLFCFIFEMMFAWLFFESGIKKTVAAFILRMPPSFTAFLGVQGGISQFFIQMLAFGYTHPIILICLAFFPISMPARYISGEIELATFDLLLTKPVHRFVIPLSIFAFLVMALCLQTSAMVLGTLAGRYWFDLKAEMIDYVRAALTGLCFFLSMGAISVFITAFQSEKAKAAGKTIGLMVLLYFFDTLVRLSTRLAGWSDFSYFQLYQPGKLVAQQASAIQCSGLSLLIAVLFLGAGLYRFCRRDL